MTQSNQKRQPRRGPHPALRVLGTLILIGIVTCAMLACLAVMYIKIVILPNAGLQLDQFTDDMNLSTTMYYTDPASGEEQTLQTLYGEENRIWVSFDKIPQNMKDAAVAIEDHRFYKHNGVDWLRTANGILSMFTGRDIQGGSTITQQFIKNLTDEDQVTVKRKVTEIFRALEFEKNHSKDEILELYLNYIYLGEQCYGVSTAAKTYFDKDVADLTLAECASIIGITNNPSKYDPYGTLQVTDPDTGEIKTCRDFNKERQKTILWRMKDLEMITQEEYDEAVAQELVFSRGEGEKRNNIYSWYADAVITQVIADLQETYGFSKSYASSMVYSGGLKIDTCMNPTIQEAVDTVYENRENLNYTSSSGQAMQSAITVVDNQTGAVVAMAGGVGEKTGSLSFNRATRSRRPPGSSIKPLSVYAPALDLGVISPLSTEVDSPVEDGWPVNSYGSYRGRMSITQALKVSCNTIAVKTLNKVTLEESFKFMQERFHIQLVEKKTVGNQEFTDLAPAALGLGGLTEGVSTYEMAAAYSSFARSGAYITPRIYNKVLDNKGAVILEGKSASEAAMKESTAYYITSMLQTVMEPGGTGTKAKFSGMPIAGKTGTTTSKKDLWFVGYTPYYTAAVWTGYDQQEKVAQSNPSPIMWKQVMEKIHGNLEYKDFPQPESGKLVTVTICTVSGDKATQYCAGHTTTATVLEESAPTRSCTVHTASSNQRPPSNPGFNVDDPNTWPTDDPNFDPSNPDTYPGTSDDPNGGEATGGEGTEGEGGAGTGDPADPNGGAVTPPEAGGETAPTG